jgi:hypothetical protein
MSFLGSLLGNETSHIGNLFSGFGAKNGEQLLLGAADPLSAKLWGGVTGQHFTPMVGQLGGETNAQYAQSDAQGVNTGPARFMGGIANAIAGAEAGGYFGGGGGLLTAGAGALDGGGSGGMPGGIGAFSPGGSQPTAMMPGLGAPSLEQSPQQKLATALMMPSRPQQGSALDNVSQITQTPTVRMLNQQAPFSLGGSQ